MFVVPRLSEGGQAATMNNRGFFVANFYRSKITAIAGLLDFSVTGNQSGWPSLVLGRNAKGSAFPILAYQSDKEYISVNRIKPQDTMRNDKINGVPTGDSNPAYAELRQLITEYFRDVSGSEGMEDSLFQMFESSIAATEELGFNTIALLRFSWVYRRTSKFLKDIEKYDPTMQILPPCSNN